MEHFKSQQEGWDGVPLWEETNCHNQDGDKAKQLGKWLAQIQFMLWITSTFFFPIHVCQQYANIYFNSSAHSILAYLFLLVPQWNRF